MKDEDQVKTALGRAAQEGDETGTGRLMPYAGHHHKATWLRDVILGGQDGLVNILGTIRDRT